MSAATTFLTAVPIFQGAQCKYYIVDDKKYHVYFPVGWAHEHKTFGIDYTAGPNECKNCDDYGSIRGVFVGYCSNCLQTYCESGDWRGNLVAPGMSVEMLEDGDMWLQYPYMSGVPKSEIGDEEGADLTDQGINLEKFSEAIDALRSTRSMSAKQFVDIVIGSEENDEDDLEQENKEDDDNDVDDNDNDDDDDYDEKMYG